MKYDKKKGSWVNYSTEECLRRIKKSYNYIPDEQLLKDTEDLDITAEEYLQLTGNNLMENAER